MNFFRSESGHVAIGKNLIRLLQKTNYLWDGHLRITKERYKGEQAREKTYYCRRGISFASFRRDREIFLAYGDGGGAGSLGDGDCDGGASAR